MTDKITKSKGNSKDWTDWYKNSVASSEAVSFWRRTAAFLTDLLLINIVIISQFGTALQGYMRNITLEKGITGQVTLPSGLYVMLFVISLLALLYFTFFEYYLGQTVGDMLFKIKTISLKRPDGKISLWTAAVRNCYIIPFFPFYIFWFVEPMHLAFYKERFLERITITKTVMVSVSGRQKGRYTDYRLEKV